MELLDAVATISDRKVGSPAAHEARETILAYLRRRIPEAHLTLEHFNVQVLSRFRAAITIGDGEGDGGEVHNVHVYDNTGAPGPQTVSGALYDTGIYLWPWRRWRARGKIVVFRYSGLVHRMLQVRCALAARARAVILVGGHAAFITKGLGYPPIGDCPMVAVGVTRDDWLRIKSQGGEGTGVTIAYQRELEPAQGVNIVVDLPGNDPAAPVLVCGAHYDSWYEGWQDNAIAVQMLADLLEQLAREKLSLRFRGIFFDAEEVGLLGAGHHVDHNKIADYRFYLNLEMPLPARGKSTKLLLHNLKGPLRRLVRQGGLRRRGFYMLPLHFIYRLVGGFPADIHHFYLKKIPSLTTFCSHPYYHTPWDNRGNLRLDLYDGIKKDLLDLIRRIDRFMTEKN